MASKKKEYIKPCPFCGSKKVCICRTNKNACWVECYECEASTKSRKRRSDAIMQWNVRTPIKPIYAEAVVEFDDEWTDKQRAKYFKKEQKTE